MHLPHGHHIVSGWGRRLNVCLAGCDRFGYSNHLKSIIMATRSGLSLEVQFEQKPQQEIPLLGFLFGCNGLLLQMAEVTDNRLEFNLEKVRSADARQSVFDTGEVRVFIVPASDGKVRKVRSVEALEKFKPYEAMLSVDLQGNAGILPIPEFITQFWMLCRCRVKGKISKWFKVGNTWADRAVCRARVRICEVDRIRYWIEKIPDTIIARIPDAILRPEEVIKWPIPIPDPPPFRVAALKQPAGAQDVFNTMSLTQMQTEVAGKLPELNRDIRQKMASGNLSLIRETIVEHYALLHPWFCLWPWYWPWFYRCTEKKVVYTDANGRFDTQIFHNCLDKPDIYIWIEYFIDGAWTTVYHPSIPCNTRWNYVCGSDINIHITDPRVPGNCCCNCTIPGELVWVRAIGDTCVSRIYQKADLNLPPPGQSIPYNRIGLTDAAAIGDSFFATTAGDYKRPFGGDLRFYMGFGSDLHAAGYHYYRWSYQKVNDAGLTPVAGSVEQIKTVEMKRYSYTYIDPEGDVQIGYNDLKLGPVSVGSNDNLYIIPPVNPAGAPFAVTENDPIWTENIRDTRVVSFNSEDLINDDMHGGDGLYEFTLELFDKDGNKLSAIPKALFKTPTIADEDLSENAPEDMLVASSATTASAFKMLVRVDNSGCNSQIFTVNVNGVPASLDCCGFVKYTEDGAEADLQLSFLATHPNNFAVFSFGVNKGTCGAVPGAGAQGMVIDDASGYTLNSGIYDKHFTPEALLDNCYNNGTGKAAFAETLSVIAIATNGTSRQSGKDAPYRVAAFAMEP